MVVWFQKLEIIIIIIIVIIIIIIMDGGLGVRRVSMLATSAYLASAASTKSLVSAILNKG